jgi:hypothetical protein
MSEVQAPTRAGMSRATARTIEFAIVAVSVAALVMLFQPFSLELYSVGAGLVIVAGLLFNLVPFCEPGRPLRSLLNVTLVIAVIFAIVTGLALAAAQLYATFLTGV